MGSFSKLKNSLKLGSKEKILIRKTGDRIIANYDDTGIYCEQSLYFLYDIHVTVKAGYLLGLLNSKILTWYYRNFLVTNLDSTPQIKNYDLDNIPVILSNDQESIGSLVGQIIAVKRTDPVADTSDLEAEIDRMVYQLYGLTEEEIKIVEGAKWVWKKNSLRP